MTDTNEQGLNTSWTDYGQPDDVRFGPRLSSFALHTAEWRGAFLERLMEVASLGDIEAAARVYDLLLPPKKLHCATLAKLAGVEGSGKLAILNVLRSFMDEWIGPPMQSLPPISDFDTMDDWNAHVHAGWASENARERWVVKKYAAILNGDVIGQERRLADELGQLLQGPWRVPQSAEARPCR